MNGTKYKCQRDSNRQKGAWPSKFHLRLFKFQWKKTVVRVAADLPGVGLIGEQWNSFHFFSLVLLETGSIKLANVSR